MAAQDSQEEAKIHRFLEWLQANGAELRGCTLRHCGSSKGFGVFSTNHPVGNNGDGVAMVVPLDLAITPMRVLQDPFIGPRCRALFDEGEVDDRFLVMLFLLVERLRPGSLWKPYLDMLPSSFRSTVWFTEDELAELKGSTLHRATILQCKQLQSLYENKVKGLAEELLRQAGELESLMEVRFEDFLWANSIFWTRALNIPFPMSYVFPESIGAKDNDLVCMNNENGPLSSCEMNSNGIKEGEDIQVQKDKVKETFKSASQESVWVEGLIPGIDFCNHGSRPAATWQVDTTGAVTGIPAAMYLVLADQNNFEVEKEICISYGDKGNEELLYLYGFVVDNNPDDYLMVHYPVEAFQKDELSEKKTRLLEMQKAELRCLLPISLLHRGFFSGKDESEKEPVPRPCSYTWSGQRKVPSYLSNLVFPQEFIAALRTVAMKENELIQVLSLLEELVGSDEGRQPSDKDVQAAIWEICGDYGALELLVDLLRVKIASLEEGTGTEASDNEVLGNSFVEDVEDYESNGKGRSEPSISRHRWSCLIYRREQKRLARSFLREAEQALELCAEQALELCTSEQS